jgi:putative transposase
LSKALSPFSKRKYGRQRVCRVLGLARSTHYARRKRAMVTNVVAAKRGPKTAHSDDALVVEIRRTIVESPFVGEGHRKVWAQLRARDIRSSLRRVLRLMRENQLLAPTRVGRAHGPAAHDGRIIAEKPDTMWGIDATATMTIDDGSVTVFAAIDHCTGECVGIHCAVVGTRFEAMEVLRQGVRASFGRYAPNIAIGLTLRHDHGSQFVSRDFQSELRMLGIVSSPAFVREPQGNGCIERFIRTLKEQLLWLRSFRNAEELRRALHDFRRLYNERWIVQRHGYLTPNQVRRRFADCQSAAA